jgi:hypothetical protein
MFLYPGTGEVVDPNEIDWFSQWLRDSYSNRSSKPIGFRIKQLKPVRKPILLNCLDVLYGHCLLKLFNAQYYIDNHPDYDLIIMAQPFLEYFIPEGAAQVWIVDLPLRSGTNWNDWLASEIRNAISIYPQCMLSVAFPHPHPEDIAIERFVGIPPMDVDKWKNSVRSPVITFIWREDRVWGRNNPNSFFKRSSPVEQQKENVIRLAQCLRKKFPSLDFAIAGIGHFGTAPEGILDLTSKSVNESLERSWCERYSKSHIAIGIHGSNMLLPSALAGTIIELIPEDRYGNSFQDIQVSVNDPRATLVRYRLVPLTATPDEVVVLAISLIDKLLQIILNFERPWNDHAVIQKDPWLVSRKSKEFRE